LVGDREDQDAGRRVVRVVLRDMPVRIVARVEARVDEVEVGLLPVDAAGRADIDGDAAAERIPCDGALGDERTTGFADLAVEILLCGTNRPTPDLFPRERHLEELRVACHHSSTLLGNSTSIAVLARKLEGRQGYADTPRNSTPVRRTSRGPYSRRTARSGRRTTDRSEMFFHTQEMPLPTTPDPRLYGTDGRPNIVDKAAGMIKDTFSET